MVKVPSQARSAYVLVRIDITGDQYTVTPLEAEGIPVGADD